MRKIQSWTMQLVLFCIAIFSYIAPTQAQQRQQLAVPTDIDRWIVQSFSKGKIPPFSFVYDGKNSAGFIRKWQHSIKKEQSNEQIIKYKVTYTDPVSRLEVVCDITGFKDFNTVEWAIHFTNLSSQPTPQIKDVQVVHYTAQSQTRDKNFTLLHALGSNGKRADFQARLTTLRAGDEYTLMPENGRSSDTSAFPFFNIIAPNNHGIVVAIGWTGTWRAELACDDEQSISLKSGMRQMDLFLHPNESIRTPRIAMLFWQGEEYMTGNNAFRRFMLTHHTRKIDDAYAHSPLCGGFNWGDPDPCNEYGCLTEDYAIALINRHRQFGILPEVFWLDAGWYTGSGGPNYEGRNWYNQVGNWSVDSDRFPNGLKPIADAAHKVGTKFMVWFEPERVYKGSALANEHPEWLLSTASKGDNFLLDLGNKEALNWLCQHIGDMIQENGIDYYRQDFNMPINGYWEYNDEPNRIGMREIRHIEGLYAYWDYLLERFPNMIIDNCASGGRRLDLETMSRSIPLWRTDYQYGEVNGYQNHTYALNFFLPLHGTGVYGGDNYNFRSSMSSAMVTNWEITSRKGSLTDLQRAIALFKELRPYYMEDFYPLTGVKDLTGDDVWIAYQLNRPSDNTGIVMAFRRKDNTSDTLTIQLCGLNPQLRYSLFDDNTQKTSTYSGQELLNGITITIDQPLGSLLLKYAPEK